MGSRTYLHPVTEAAAQRFVALDDPAKVHDVAAIYADGSLGETVGIGEYAAGLHFLMTGLDLWGEPDQLAGLEGTLSSISEGGLGALLRPGGLSELVATATSEAAAQPNPALTWAVRGNHCIDLEDDVVVGINDSADVARIRRALDEVDEDTLRARFDPERMDAEEIEPEGWVDAGDEALAALIEAFGAVRRMYAEATEAVTVTHG